jgi:hypothetical protein
MVTPQVGFSAGYNSCRRLFSPLFEWIPSQVADLIGFCAFVLSRWNFAISRARRRAMQPGLESSVDDGRMKGGSSKTH